MIYNIPENCMNKWTTIRLDLANQPPSTFSFLPVNAGYLKDRFLYGYIYTAEYKPTECITQQQQLIIGCQNKWVYMFPVGGGDFLFWPTKVEAHNPKLILGWLNITNNMNLQCEAAPQLAVPNVTGEYETTFGRVTLRQTGNDITGTFPQPGGTIKGTLTSSAGRLILEGRWFTSGHAGGKIQFKFNPDYTTGWTGALGYAEATPSITWDGKRVG
ncbi:hypothetical protein ABIE66_006010 [Peribacillus sp. B2I2]|uniref:hypothetical protein n=1 Tax=Peribacillus sp. B2I2 TaxID=3156468 RepID=UPI0035141B21